MAQSDNFTRTASALLLFAKVSVAQPGKDLVHRVPGYADELRHQSDLIQWSLAIGKGADQSGLTCDLTLM